MGTKMEPPDTIDPELEQMIDRYVNDALMETGTSELAHGRLARASVPPPFDFLASPPLNPAAELVLELAEAMAEAEIAALPATAYIVAPRTAPIAPPRVLVTPLPREFVDETPTDRNDDEPTGVFERPRR